MLWLYNYILKGGLEVSNSCILKIPKWENKRHDNHLPKAKELLTVTDTISSGYFMTFSLYTPKIPINYHTQFFELQTNSE